MVAADEQYVRALTRPVRVATKLTALDVSEEVESFHTIVVRHCETSLILFYVFLQLARNYIMFHRVPITGPFIYYTRPT
jgi:hypothetical protein